MNLKQRLMAKYGVNQPIFIGEIKLEGVSEGYIRKELPRMVKRGEIERYVKGVYFFAEETPYGKTRLYPIQVSSRKYIRRGSKVIGFYSGLNLQNRLGLSTQVPFTTEVTTNAVNRCRRVKIGVYRFLLLPPRVRVTNRNVTALQLLDVIEKIGIGSFGREDIEILARFIRENRLTKSKILKLVDLYPKDTFLKLRKTGLINVLA